MDGAAERPVVGLLGAFDTGDLGEVALRRVMETQLARRRPDVAVVAFAPFGVERPIPGDEGRPARSIGESATGGLDVNALILTGDVLADSSDWAARYRVPEEAVARRGVAELTLTGTRGGAPAATSMTWFAVGSPAGARADLTGLAGKDVWARDRAIQERLGVTAVLSGDPVLLAREVFLPDPLRRRLELLRMCGAVPAGKRLVVEAGAGGLSSEFTERLVEAMHAALRGDPKLSVVVVSLDPTRAPTLTVSGLPAERVHQLPNWSGLDDVAATMSGSVAVVATSRGGAHLAAALGVPIAAVDGDDANRFDPAIPLLGADLAAAVRALLVDPKPVAIDVALQTLDGAFTTLSDQLPRSTASSTPSRDEGQVQSALSILQQRLADERTALQAELSRVQEELEHLQRSPSSESPGHYARDTGAGSDAERDPVSGGRSAGRQRRHGHLQSLGSHAPGADAPRRAHPAPVRIGDRRQRLD